MAQVATWSAGYVKAAVDKGIITGYKDNTFKPTKVITVPSWRRSCTITLEPAGRPASLYRLRPQERYRERHHLGKLHAVRCDDRRRSVLDRRSGLGCGTAE
ncbi:MAG: S-layer homology domain-containing protein [Butyricicoccus sp.]